MVSAGESPRTTRASPSTAGEYVEQRGADLLIQRLDDGHDLGRVAGRIGVRGEGGQRAADVVDDEVEITVGDPVDGLGAEPGRGEISTA